MAQLAPTATDAFTQLSVSLKSPALGPWIAIEEMFSTVAPMYVKVTGTAGLDVPTFGLPKLIVVAESVAAVAGVAAAVAGVACVSTGVAATTCAVDA